MKILKWGVIAFVVLVVIAAIGGGGDDDNAADEADTPIPAKTTAAAPVETAPSPAPPPAPKLTARERLDAALEPEKATVEDVTGNEITIHAPTPTGGFGGASTGDLNRHARAIYTAVYDDAGYTRQTVVVFKGGLVDTRTGKDLDDVNTGIFTMSKADAAAIDWSDDDAMFSIDFTNFRDFAHPALKQDD